ncbi:MAG: DnaJ C-terminal domain-containing protein [Candidatus Latescibacterota bacterium]|jgi:curved DNA-binding protein
MEYRDYYSVLGVSRDATPDQIKRAYRRLARKHHPDLSKEPEAEARFRAVSEAHEVLGDPEKRSAYDALGSGWQAGQEFQPPPAGAAGRGWSDLTSDEAAQFSDFFAGLFGGFPPRRDQPRSRRGQDQTALLRLGLQDCFTGVTRQLELSVPELDSQGRLVSRPRTLKVRLPAGLTQGQQVRLAGQGGAGVNGGSAGDLFLEIDLEPHPYFRPEGRDIHVHLPVAPWEAALGARVSVPTLAGPVRMKVPPGSLGGKRLRLKGRGLPGTPPGDAYFQIEIVTPPAATDEAKEAYAQMAKAFAFNPRAKLGV